MISDQANKIFEYAIDEYHRRNELVQNPPAEAIAERDVLSALLLQKCFVDLNQWHLEDEIRNPLISPESALSIKRLIDSQNQLRTDLVEKIDSYYYERFSGWKYNEGASINTESPAWALDRLSILALKIYHMRQELNRDDAPSDHAVRCGDKLNVLLLQRVDLSASIDQLLLDIRSGAKIMKVYRQMKMYNDRDLNPILYNSARR